MLRKSRGVDKFKKGIGCTDGGLVTQTTRGGFETKERGPHALRLSGSDIWTSYDGISI